MSCDGKPACQQLRELQYPEYPGPFSQTYITTGRRAPARARAHTHTHTHTHTRARARASGKGLHRYYSGRNKYGARAPWVSEDGSREKKDTMGTIRFWPLV